MTDAPDARDGRTIVAALYKFVALPDFDCHRAPLEAACERAGVCGTLLLAPEGINGTIAGQRAGIDAVLTRIRDIPGCADLDWKESFSAGLPFKRMKVRLKREIVSMGVEGIDPNRVVGTYVAPEDWNDLIAQPDVVVVDTRNDYEVAIGTFAGAVNPQTASFREFPAWVREKLLSVPEGSNSGARVLREMAPNNGLPSVGDDPSPNTGLPSVGQKRKIAMFCTGGIRCEKSTALLKEMGFEEVYHLKGGILKYLEVVPAEASKWQGECFVFDERVSVGHGLEPGPYQLCSICRMPFIAGDAAGGYARTPCPDCTADAGAERKAAAAERQKQIDLAEARGERHVGPKREPS